MKITMGLLLAATLSFSPAVFADGPKVLYYAIPGDTQLPFSDAVRVGNMLYLSGQLGFDQETSRLVEGGITAETRQTMENIKASLEKYGSSMAEVVKCTVFMADIKEWADMNKVYVSYFPANLPARSALGSSGLALGARTEIECIATVK